MSEDRKTLEDLIGKKIQFLLDPVMAQCMMEFMVSSDRSRFDTELQYEIMKFYCLLDIKMHQLGTQDCKVGSPSCGLLPTLDSFRVEFKSMIEGDKNYTMDDFVYKI